MSLVSLLFFGSGFAALVYELLWFRQLGFIFGNTVHAATTVVAAYMGGLALGAYLFGRRARTVQRPLRLFGLLEAGIGLYALAMPWLLGLVRAAYRAGYHELSDDLSVLTPLRFALAFLALLLPTTLMGGTLPLLSEALLRARADFGRRLGWLYGINTLGATAGVLGGGFLLLPAFGLPGTNAAAVLVNLVIGFSAWHLGRHPTPAATDAEERAEAAAPAEPGARPALVLGAMAFSGFIALAFEVVWFRALILVFGSTTYSFCAMLGVFLAGIGIGSALFGWIADRVKRDLLVFAAAEVAIGALMLFALHRFDGMPEFLLGFLARHGFAWPPLVAAQFLITLQFLLGPTILMGIAFTAAARAVRAVTPSPGRAVSRVYVWNTAGCVAGSALGGFVLLPALGLERALFALVFAALALGLVLALAARARRAGLAVALLAVLAAGLAAARPPAWDPKLMTAGPYFGPHNMVAGGQVILREQLRTKKMVYFREGVTATAAVMQGEDNGLSFTMDGKVEADTYPRGMVVQRMIGHLPMLFHPNPRKVMNLGLGAGCTLGALGTYPVDWLEVVEIEPAVTNVASAWAAYNHDVIRHPKLRVTINDGRNHFFCTTNRYDVITSDPYEPVVGGASHLFTVEHFRLARRCLAPGGIMGQWVPMYEMSQRDFLAILRSFTHVFPDSALFFNGLDIVMIGFRDEVRLDLDVLRRHFEEPAVRDSLAGIGLASPEMLLGMFVAEMRRSPQFIGPGPLHTDAHPIVEFSAPRNALAYTVDQNQEVLTRNFTSLPEELLADLAPEQREEARRQHEALRLALEANVQNAQDRTEEAVQTLMKAHELAPGHPVIMNELAGFSLRLARNLQGMGQLEQAANYYQIALHFNADEFYAYYQLIHLGMMAGQQAFALDLINRAIERYPQAPVFYTLRGKYRLGLGDEAGLREDFELALAMAPNRVDLWTEYARIARALNDQRLAERCDREAFLAERMPL